MIVHASIQSFWMEAFCADFLLFVHICIFFGNLLIRLGDPFNWFNSTTLLYLSQTRTWISNAICYGVVCVQWFNVKFCPVVVAILIFERGCPKIIHLKIMSWTTRQQTTMPKTTSLEIKYCFGSLMFLVVSVKFLIHIPIEYHFNLIWGGGHLEFQIKNETFKLCRGYKTHHDCMWWLFDNILKGTVGNYEN